MASKKILIQVDVTTKSAEVQINKVVDSMKQLEGATTKVTKATEKGRTQTGLNNAILLETGRLASDASYGFTAMANNLGQIVTLFGSFVETNNGVVASFKELGKSILGMGGVMIAIQLLISFGPKLLDMLTGTTQRVKDLEKAFDDAATSAGEQIGKIEALTSILKSSTESTVEKRQALDELNRSHKNLNLKLDEENNLTDESITKIDDYIETIKEKAKAQAIVSLIQKEYIELLKLENEEVGENLTFIDKLKTAFTIRKDYNAEAINEEKSLEKRREKLGEIEQSIAKLIASLGSYKTTGFEADVLNTVNSLKKVTDIITDPEQLAEGKTALQLWAEDSLGIIADTNLKELEIVNKSNKERNKREETAFKQRMKIARLEAEGKLDLLDMYGQGLNLASELAGKNTGVGKALAIASTTMSTYSAAQRAYESQFLPVPTPSSPIRAEVARGVAILSGLAQVKSILAVKTPAMKEVSGVSGAAAGAGTVQAPDFNVVGVGGVSQLATTLAGVTGQPIKAFVVSKEISSAQELDRNITSTASIG